VSTEPRASSRRGGIARRLAVALSLLLTIFAGAAALAFAGLHELHEALHAVEDDVARMRSVLNLATAVRDQYAHMAHTIILADDSHREMYEDAAERVRRTAAELAPHSTEPSAASALEEIRKASAELDDVYRKRLLPAVRNPGLGSPAALHPHIMDTVDGAQAAADRLSAASEQSIAAFGAHARLVQHSAIRWLLGMLAAALTCAVGVAVYLHRSVARPVAALAAGASRIGSGDLDVRLQNASGDELGRLAEQFNAMAAALKENQARLVAHEKLAASGRLAAGVAHEINNPLGVILGHVSLLRRRGSPDEAELAIIASEAERCRDIVEDLVELARNEPLPREEVDLRGLCEETVSRLQVSSGRQNVAVTIAGQATGFANRKRLLQLLHNLVLNALEAVPDHGHVQISLTGSRASGAEIAISDDGPGIKAADRSFIFEPFFTTKPSGRGLGLAVSRSIARAHGGDLELLPSEQGATFRLRLPPGAAAGLAS
jgi:two-component system, NtrC family, sensor kinase